MDVCQAIIYSTRSLDLRSADPPVACLLVGEHLLLICQRQYAVILPHVRVSVCLYVCVLVCLAVVLYVRLVLVFI